MAWDKFQIIVLAAGKGTRMGNQDRPKVLMPLKGKPMLGYLLKAIEDSGVCQHPALVIGHQAEKIKQAFGDKYLYIFQKEQLGTGHAMLVARPKLVGKADNIMIFYGDHPLISPALIKNLSHTHLAQKNILTMATTTVPDFKSWRSEFLSFAKIIRDAKGQIQKIVEKKDVTKDQENIKEINPGYYCFQADWLWAHLDQLTKNNVQKEYHLPGVVAKVTEEGQRIGTIRIEPKEALGINTPIQFEEIEKLL